MQKQHIDLYLIAAKVVLMATLLTYLQHVVAIRIGHVLGVLTVTLVVLFYMSNPKYLAIATRIVKNSPHFWIFVFSLLGAQFIANLQGLIGLRGGVIAIGHATLMTFAYLAFPAVLKGERSGRLWLFLSKMGAFFSLLGVLIILTGGIEIFGILWEPSYYIGGLGIRSTRSIFFDENFFAIVALMGFVSSLFVLNSKLLNKLCARSLLCANLLGILLSHSRIAYVAIVIAMIMWYVIDAKMRSKVLVILIAGSIGLIGVFMIQTNPLVRAILDVERGITGHDLLWPVAFQAIAERPLAGWGIGNIAYVIRRQGLSAASFHNSFLDFFTANGILAGFIYIWLIVVSITRLYFSHARGVDRKFLLTAIISMLIIMQFTTYAVGGISFGSFVFTFLLGMANAASIKINRKSSFPSSAKGE